MVAPDFAASKTYPVLVVTRPGNGVTSRPQGVMRTSLPLTGSFPSPTTRRYKANHMNLYDGETDSPRSADSNPLTKIL